MISLTYACKACTFKTPVLDDAQSHSNDTRHHVGISGFLSPNKEPKVSAYNADAAQRTRLRDAAIMRAARDKGLLRK